MPLMGLIFNKVKSNILPLIMLTLITGAISFTVWSFNKNATLALDIATDNYKKELDNVTGINTELVAEIDKQKDSNQVTVNAITANNEFTTNERTKATQESVKVQNQIEEVKKQIKPVSNTSKDDQVSLIIINSIWNTYSDATNEIKPTVKSDQHT